MSLVVVKRLYIWREIAHLGTPCARAEWLKINHKSTLQRIFTINVRNNGLPEQLCFQRTPW